jgi:hypothetical protein
MPWAPAVRCKPECRILQGFTAFTITLGAMIASGLDVVLTYNNFDYVKYMEELLVW